MLVCVIEIRERTMKWIFFSNLRVRDLDYIKEIGCGRPLVFGAQAFELCQDPYLKFIFNSFTMNEMILQGSIFTK